MGAKFRDTLKFPPELNFMVLNFVTTMIIIQIKIIIIISYALTHSLDALSYILDANRARALMRIALAYSLDERI